MSKSTEELRVKLANTKTFNYNVYLGQYMANSCIPYEGALDEITQLLDQELERRVAEATVAAYELLYWKYKELNNQSVDIKFAEAYGILMDETTLTKQNTKEDK